MTENKLTTPIFHLEDYVDTLGNFDMLTTALKTMGYEEGTEEYERKADECFNLPITFTNGYAYSDIPDFGRIKWLCKTDDEIKKMSPTKFDIYGDIDQCGVNRWMIFYVTQNLKIEVEPINKTNNE